MIKYQTNPNKGQYTTLLATIFQSIKNMKDKKARNYHRFRGFQGAFTTKCNKRFLLTPGPETGHEWDK